MARTEAEEFKQEEVQLRRAVEVLTEQVAHEREATQHERESFDAQRRELEHELQQFAVDERTRRADAERREEEIREEIAALRTQLAGARATRTDARFDEETLLEERAHAEALRVALGNARRAERHEQARARAAEGVLADAFPQCTATAAAVREFVQDVEASGAFRGSGGAALRALAARLVQSADELAALAAPE